MISFLSSLLVMASISTNAIGAISTSNNSINLKTNNNSINTNSIDLSKINAQVKNNWVSQSVWNQFQLQNANVNLDYHMFNTQLKTMSWKQVILSNITKGIDYHFNNLEYILYNQGNIFANLLNQNQVWITILGQKNATLALNDNNSDILKPFSEPNKAVSTFYLRVSNNNSMNWNVNHSYLDVTLNICNFQYDNSYWTKGALPRFIASANYNNSVTGLDKSAYNYLTKPYQSHVVLSRSKISAKDISTQFNTWSNANNFIDYYEFSAKVGTYLDGYYKNYYDQKETQRVGVNYDTALKQGANYGIGSYNQIRSKSTHSIVPANEYNSEFSDLNISFLDSYNFYDYGNAIFDISFPTLQNQSTDNNLYLSFWFVNAGETWYAFYLKVTSASLSINYNTNIFDNIYSI